MFTEELLSTIILVVVLLTVILIAFILSKIPGIGYLFKALLYIFVVLWTIVLFCLRVFMYSFVGFMIVIYFTFTAHPQGILYNGEPINFLLSDQKSEVIPFILLYAIFCLIMQWISSKITFLILNNRRINFPFSGEVTFVVMFLVIKFLFPTVLYYILPSFSVGNIGTYVLAIMPLLMYIEGRRTNYRRKRAHLHPSELNIEDQVYRQMEENEIESRRRSK